MNKTLENFNIRDFLPESLKRDKDSVAIADAVTPIFKFLFEKTKVVRINDGTPDQILDFIAYEENVPFYDSSMTIEEKRSLIEKAPIVHKIKGTVAAVEEVASIFFKNAKVREWFEYGGKPYFFRIETDEAFKDESDIAKMFRLVNSTKNLRSRLEGVWFKDEGGLNLQAVEDPEDNNNINLYMMTGLSIAGVWPYVTTLGRGNEQTIELHKTDYKTQQQTYKFAGRFFLDSSVDPEQINREYRDSMIFNQEIGKQNGKYTDASNDLMVSTLMTGSEQIFNEQFTSSKSTIEQRSEYSKSINDYLICGRFYVGKGAML